MQHVDSNTQAWRALPKWECASASTNANLAACKLMQLLHTSRKHITANHSLKAAGPRGHTHSHDVMRLLLVLFILKMTFTDHRQC